MNSGPMCVLMQAQSLANQAGGEVTTSSQVASGGESSAEHEQKFAATMDSTRGAVNPDAYVNSGNLS